MKFLRPIIALGFRFIIAAKVLFNRYEAGVRWGAGRSWLPAYVRDARFDADSATRDEIVRKSRYFERNNAIVNRLADLFEQYTVGCGLQIIPASSDEEWNQTAKGWWEIWGKFCDLTSLQTFGTIQSLVARSWFIDGEIFILKTRGREFANSPAKPRIQLIESHRVATPSRMAGEEGKRIIDGIELNGNGRPVAYHVRDGFDEETYRRIPAEQIIHVFEPSRPGMYRGLPFFYPVLNDLHDLDDLEVMEMLAAKDAAEKSTFVETASGELNSDTMRRERFSQSTQNSSGTDIDQIRTRYIKDAIGGRVAALKMGEKVHQFLSNRPTVTQQWYWDYLTSKICAGVGISKLLVYPWSMQGTVTRADLDVMSGFFKARSAVLASAFTEVWSFVMGWAIYNDVALADPPADWFNVTTRAPRSVNVDVGRNSSAMLAELKAGARTYQDVYAELGQDWREMLRQKAKEAKLIRDLATEFGIDAIEISDSVLPSAKPDELSNVPGQEPPLNPYLPINRFRHRRSRNFDPSQPREDDGKWSESGGGGGGTGEGGGTATETGKKSSTTREFKDDHEAKQYADENLHPDKQKFDVPERAALTEHQRNSYDLNSALLESRELSPSGKGMVYSLDSAFAKSKLKEGLTVYHTSADFAGWSKVKEGQTIQSPAYLSTTLAKGTLDQEMHKDRQGVRIEIEAPKGSRAVYMDGLFKKWESEVEVLLPRQAKYEVVSRTEEGGVLKLKLKVKK